MLLAPPSLRLPIAAVLLAGTTACGSDPRELTIEITLGHEQGAFQQEPVVNTVQIKAFTVDDAVFAQDDTTPGGTFELGLVDVETPLRFEVSGFGVDGATLVRGRSLTVTVGQLDGDLLPVFAQRVESWARPPGNLDHAHLGGIGMTLGERYVVHTGGTVVGGEPAAGALAYYDLLSWDGPAGGVLSDTPGSVVVAASGSEALFIGNAQASWIDFAGGTSSDQPAPEGLGTFAAIVGGQTVRGPDASYLVGGTRGDAPSDKVLIVYDDFSLSVVTLSTPRQGAAATWVDGVGLVIAAGSAAGPGVEVIAEGATIAVPRAFPPDASQGAAASADLQPGIVLLLGGMLAGADAGARRLNLFCSADCVPAALDSQLPQALDSASAFSWTGGEVLVVGNAASDGMTRSYLVATASEEVRELPLREPRRGAVVVAAPNGTLALMGGELADGAPALTVETLFPR